MRVMMASISAPRSTRRAAALATACSHVSSPGFAPARVAEMDKYLRLHLHLSRAGIPV